MVKSYAGRKKNFFLNKLTIRSYAHDFKHFIDRAKEKST